MHKIQLKQFVVLIKFDLQKHEIFLLPDFTQMNNYALHATSLQTHLLDYHLLLRTIHTKKTQTILYIQEIVAGKALTTYMKL